LLLFSFTSLLTPHRTLVNTHKINKCTKFGSILLGSSSKFSTISFIFVNEINIIINYYRIIARRGYWKYDHECHKTHQIKRVCGTCYAHEFNLNAFRHEWSYIQYSRHAIDSQFYDYMYTCYLEIIKWTKILGQENKQDWIHFWFLTRREKSKVN
jgi:hypothetical protein